MAKTERITVWVVSLPNGKKVEIDPEVARRYFRSDIETTPFSHLHVEPIVKTVSVKAVPAPKSTASPNRRGRVMRSANIAARARGRANRNTLTRKKAGNPPRKARARTRSKITTRGQKVRR
ncbi:MAG: hypothetical protein AB1696_00470 [Planctomycetota bacterium]